MPEIARAASLCWLLALLPMSPGCTSQDEDGPLCLYDCDLCSANGCPEDRCGILVVMADKCEGRAEFAEVAVGECLEEQTVHPGEQILLCATVMKGKSAVIHARADEPEVWVWQRTAHCTDQQAGGLLVFTIHCETASDGGDISEQEGS